MAKQKITVVLVQQHLDYLKANKPHTNPDQDFFACIGTFLEDVFGLIDVSVFYPKIDGFVFETTDGKAFKTTKTKKDTLRDMRALASFDLVEM